MIRGYAGRVLEVDPTSREFAFAPLDEHTGRLYIGGKGYGTRLLYDRTPAGLAPLGPANPLVFATGPLNGSVAPQSNRFAVVCKSLLTGGIGSATCGGSFAELTRVAKVAVNGVLISYRKGPKTAVRPGDRVTFVKAAAGG